MPKMIRLRLDHLSLFTAEPSIEVEFPRGAFCLAGANGLGKSTFLATLNFALTGIVPDPDRSFLSVQEYFRHSLGFASTYFDGRVSEDDRLVAEVEVEFAVGESVYLIKRGIFDKEELRGLTITRSNAIHVDGQNMSSSERYKQYVALLPEDIGLESFEQFVFLQHFVFTFDERRHLLFWDQKILEQVLFLTFGLDPKLASRADVLRREVERADSLVRNYQWQATELRKKLQDLEAIGKADKQSTARATKLIERHHELQAIYDADEQTLRRIDSHLRDAELKLSESVAEVASVRNEYEKEFSHQFGREGNLQHNPVIVSSIQAEECALCGTSGTHVAQSIQDKLAGNRCPLCDSPVKSSGTRAIEALKRLDKVLATARDSAAQATSRVKRLEAERKSADSALRVARSKLDAFEEENSAVLRAALATSSAGLRSAIGGYREQIQALLDKKQEQLDRRNIRRSELNQLQKSLVKQYAGAEELFVPAFRSLAEAFLGIDLDLRIEATSYGVLLVLEVRSMVRRYTFQLSESQRFFIDIALRMALIQLTSPSPPIAVLLVDTPEGSLDIAYESRAGDLFARFVLSGFNLIFTANINTSQLLLSLAEKCGRAHMEVLEMTSWTTLSDVQQQEEWRFKQALGAISAALNSKRNGRGPGGKRSKHG